MLHVTLLNPPFRRLPTNVIQREARWVGKTIKNEITSSVNQQCRSYLTSTTATLPIRHNQMTLPYVGTRVTGAIAQEGTDIQCDVITQPVNGE